MNNQSDVFISHLDRKIDKTFDDIKSRVDNLEKICVKAEEVQQHYATKYFALGIIATVFAALCGAYMVITPLYIDSKTSRLNENVEKILAVVQSATFDKKPR